MNEVRDRLFAWLKNLFVRSWLTTLLLFVLFSTLTYSIEDAGWVKETGSLSVPLLTGLAIGWLLARSRFSGWFAVCYALFMALMVAIQAAGHLLPSPGVLLHTPLLRTLDDMNLRLLELSLRMTGWVDTLRAGENVKDSGLFILLMAALLALCGTWQMWFMLRKRQALIGLLPVGLMLAINVHLSSQPLTAFMVFLLCAVLLVARTAFNHQDEDWQRRRVDYPEQLGLEWGTAAMTVALAVVMLARLAPFVGTPQGWRILSDWVASTREKTSDTATRLFSGVNPPPPRMDEDPEIFINTPNLGEIGVPISQGRETVMWVTTSDPPPMPFDSSIPVPVTETVRAVHYWRNAVYGAYTGRGWEPAPIREQAVEIPTALQDDAPLGRYFLRQEFKVEARHDGKLFSVSEPVQISERMSLRGTVVDGSRLVEGQNATYQVISAATQVTANQLASASTDYPADIRAAYLALPDSLPGRVRTLAQRLGGGEGDAYHKALRIQDYLRENYPYDLKVPLAPDRRDVVDYFLFDAPGGFCSHYASAMTVMLRVVGVPARVATGYAMGEYNFQAGAYQVPASSAHAWVEVYFPEYGWVEFEPTAGRDVIVYPEESQPAAGGPVESLQTEQAESGPLGPYLAGLLSVLAVLLLALPFALLRLFRVSRRSPSAQINTLYRRIRRVLAWAGLPSAASMTPDEYLLAMRGQLAPYGQLSRTLAQVTALYRESVYSSHAPEEWRVRAAGQLWQQSAGEWLALWLRAAWDRARARIVGGEQPRQD